MNSDFKIAATILIIFGIVIGFIVLAGDTIGLTDADAETMISVLPGIFVILVGFWGATQTRGFMLSGVVTVIGLGFAYLIYLLNEANLLIPDLEMSVTELQLIVIVVFLIISVAVAVSDR